MSDDESIKIHVRQLGLAHNNEYRSALAQRINDEVYLIVPQEIPPGQQWEFGPGDRVICVRVKLRHRHAREAFLARQRVP